MAYTSGIASNYDDFITKLKDAAVASGHWTLDVDATQTSEGHNSREIILSASDVTVGFKSRGNLTDEFNYHIMVCNAYNGANDFYNQAGSSAIGRTNGQRPAIYQVNNDSTFYHFMCSSNRIAGVYTTRGRWFTFYLGKFLPYATPKQYPRPHFVGGNCNYDDRHDTTTIDNRKNFFVNNSDTAKPRVKFNDTWYGFEAGSDDFDTGVKFAGNQQSIDGVDNVYNSPGGDIVRFPCIFRTGSDIGDYHLGELENCYLVGANVANGGSTITDDGTYIVSHNINDTTSNNLAIKQS